MRQKGLSARRRLEVLKYAEENGNVRQTCKRFGVSRMTFYSWRGRYEKEGLRGLENKSSAPKIHYRKITIEVENEIVEFIEKDGFPSFRFECDILKMEREIDISPMTLRSILKRNNVDYIALGKEGRKEDWYREYRRDVQQRKVGKTSERLEQK